jgi:hypothetical protein
MYFDNEVHKESDIKDRVEEVKNAIRKLIDAGLAKRTDIFQK